MERQCRHEVALRCTQFGLQRAGETELCLAECHIADVHGAGYFLRPRRDLHNDRCADRPEFLRTCGRNRGRDQDRTLAGLVYYRELGARVSLSLRTEPRKTAVALDHMGQRGCGSLL